jgi:hypothetical protein
LAKPGTCPTSNSPNLSYELLTTSSATLSVLS